MDTKQTFITKAVRDLLSHNFSVLPYMSNIFHNDLSYYLDKNNLTDKMKTALLLEYQKDSSLS